MQIDHATVALRERNEEPLRQRLAEHVVAMRTNDAHDLHLGRRAVRRRLTVAYALAESLLVREKFLRHDFVDDRHSCCILVLGFRPGEIAPAQQPHAKRLQVSWPGSVYK